MKLNGSKKILLLNETWTNIFNPCVSYKCVGSLDDARVEKVHTECNKTCDDDFIYEKVPNQCCGVCTQPYCFDDSSNTRYRIGEIWKNDNCTINECVLNDQQQPTTISYQKHCQELESCPVEFIVIKDCCPKCK